MLNTNRDNEGKWNWNRQATDFRQRKLVIDTFGWLAFRSECHFTYNLCPLSFLKRIFIFLAGSFCILGWSIHISCREFLIFLAGSGSRIWPSAAGGTAPDTQGSEFIKRRFKISLVEFRLVEALCAGAAVQDHAEEPHSRPGPWLWRAITNRIVSFLSKVLIFATLQFFHDPTTFMLLYLYYSAADKTANIEHFQLFWQ